MKRKGEDILFLHSVQFQFQNVGQPKKQKNIQNYEGTDICFLNSMECWFFTTLATATVCIFLTAAYVFMARKLKCLVEV